MKLLSLNTMVEVFVTYNEKSERERFLLHEATDIEKSILARNVICTEDDEGLYIEGSLRDVLMYYRGHHDITYVDIDNNLKGLCFLYTAPQIPLIQACIDFKQLAQYCNDSYLYEIYTFQPPWLNEPFTHMDGTLEEYRNSSQFLS